MSKTVKRVLETRIGPNGLEGLCEYDDGSTEWRAPSSIAVEGTVTRADGRIEDVEIDSASVNLTGVKPCE